MNKRLSIGALCLAIAVSAASCILVSHRTEVKNFDTHDNMSVQTPVKAHLKDGTTVVYRFGVRVSGDMLRGPGDHYDLTLAHSARIDSLPLDNVVGMEAYTTKVNLAQTIIVSSLASVGAAIGSAALAVAIFGSCPTVYSDGGAFEEAELFSTSIAPLFESRDLDRLHAQPAADGTLSLELRNEAMETHYINHLQLLEVRHDPNEFVLPDSQGRPVVVRDIQPPQTISNRAGNDLGKTLSAADGVFYSTDRRSVDRATATDMEDWIDLTAAVPKGADKTTLVFRLRNSLLSTTLLYDVMLGSAGAGAIDWLGSDLTRISSAVELGRWYERRAGLHISVWQDGGYREVVRIPDSGPISWHDVAAVIPVPAGETSLRVRVSFVADYWRIDRLGIAASVRDAHPRPIDVTEIIGSDGRAETEALNNVRAPDNRYLQTNPGQRYFVHFDAGAAGGGQSRTFLLASQGYYVEWIRSSWIRQASHAKPFVPGDEALLVALRKWSGVRESFERHFMEARVPVH